MVGNHSDVRVVIFLNHSDVRVDFCQNCPVFPNSSAKELSGFPEQLGY